MKPTPHRLAAAATLLSLLLAGCAGGDIRTRKNIAGLAASATKEAGQERYRENLEILRGDYRREWDYLGRGGPPRLGLALSGGGTRSASFSIGVLKALQKKGVLERVDVLSTVSGGSYAAYWFYAQNAYREESCRKYGRCFEPEEIFRSREEARDNLADPDSYRFQRTLAESSKILSYSHQPGFWYTLRNGVNTVANIGVQGLSIPLHWVANGLFDWEVNMTPYRHFYQNGLERTYGYVPLDYSLTRFANDRSLWGFKRVYAEPLPFARLRDFLEEEKALPYFVVNTTGGYGRRNNRFKGERNMENSVYEFTPWECGSNLFGFRETAACDDDLSFSRAVSISGAAVDGQSASVDVAGKARDCNSVIAAGINVLNLDLGYHLPDRATPWLHRAVHKLLPWPLYWLDDVVLGDRSTSAYLSDGGHAENLGLFSLVRRGVENIIVVDAEQDGESLFTSAKRLQRGVRKELGLDLVFEQEGAIDVYDAAPRQAVIEGRITGLPGADGAPADIRLVYIKLAIDREAPYPFPVERYQKKDDRFPQDSTADIFYDREQFVAYRELGRTIAGSYDFAPLLERAERPAIWEERP